MMSFLSKLKERLFKSSSKIEEGLDTIVETEATSFENQDIDGESSQVEGNKLSPKVNNSNDRKQSEVSDNGSADKKLFSKFLKKKSFEKKVRVDDKLLESLEELLISADLGVDTAIKISASFAERHYGQSLTKSEIKIALAEEIKKILRPVAVPIAISRATLQVVLVVGVNGSGKTTTIGKLANQFKEAGKVVQIVAADTFRAAAVEQLEVWGKRANIPVLKTLAGGDPAALAYDSLVSAQKENTDILIIDTAGRLQNKSDLMEELAKMVRVLRKIDPSVPNSTILVLDASIGQNAISQVEIFKKTAEISGLIMTKLDGSAKGGILVAIADQFKIPIHAIGIGEGIDDLQPFDPDEFTIALTGVDEL